ncbi:hypothetical protein Tsubulata_012589 [Turnera subulata]|uniref:Reticulon-like protein n=1 Tax=Turnera subulata TaxID=218843 RepID=A0A9Q0FNE2_9ROSI|nr:hypothetical protein Tsubulata_012589 [Turnera subulata]
MGSSHRLFNRERSVHEIFGGGFVADVILWRQKNTTIGILIVALASWVVFEKSVNKLGSQNFLNCFYSLGRPAPPLPKLHLSEEMANEVAIFMRNHVNALLSVSQDVALGKDTKLFFKVALNLLLLSVVGSLTDFVTLGYASLVIILTIPILYERFEDYIDTYVKILYTKVHRLYVKFNVECVGRARKWILEQQKLS